MSRPRAVRPLPPAPSVPPAIRAVAAGTVLAVGLSVALSLTARPAGADPVDRPAFTAGGRAAASTCATTVHTQPGGADDTAAFTAAMATALRDDPDCFTHGPTGDPQAVVYVPAGTYRLAGLAFPSNVRLEVDAAATLQEPANRATSATTPMIVWDRTGSPVTNVTLTGVGNAMTDAKRAALDDGGDAIAAFPVANYFTMNLDPATTGSTNYNPGVELVNVRGFRIANLFSVQNDTLAASAHRIPWPTSARPVLALHADKTSPLGGPFIEPADGVVDNHVDVHAPRGFGPNQVNAARDVSFSHIYSEGGTTLRLETDGSLGADGRPDRGATVDGVTGSDIVGLRCNRAVSLSPHGQRNGRVAVSDVWAYACNQGVVAQQDTKLPVASRGSFSSASVTGLRVTAGSGAQLDSTTSLWAVGSSALPLYVDPAVNWRPVITVAAQAGAFALRTAEQKAADKAAQHKQSKQSKRDDAAAKQAEKAKKQAAKLAAKQAAQQARQSAKAARESQRSAAKAARAAQQAAHSSKHAKTTRPAARHRTATPGNPVVKARRGAAVASQTGPSAAKARRPSVMTQPNRRAVAKQPNRRAVAKQPNRRA